MAIIETSKNARCFRITPPPDTYFDQNDASSYSATFRKWLYDIIISFIRKWTSKKVVLLLDNCETHADNIKDPMEQISILLLPPNCTSLQQPMNMGIIASWKDLYRGKMVWQLIVDFESRQERRDSKNVLMTGMKGLEKGFEPHILDVAR